MTHPREFESLNPVTEQVLYTVMNEERIETRDIKAKHEYRDTLIDSQLQQLRERGFVCVTKGEAYNRGAVKPPNEYEPTPKARKYEEWYSLSVPKYTLRERLNEREAYRQDWMENAEWRIKRLEREVSSLNEQQVKTSDDVQNEE